MRVRGREWFWEGRKERMCEEGNEEGRGGKKGGRLCIKVEREK